MCQNREVFFVVVAKPETKPEYVNILADCLASKLQRQIQADLHDR